MTFTVNDDELDNFCTGERDLVRASANRSPLRTPSVSTPHVDGESFPWQEQLHKSPIKSTYVMPSIPDEYEEDLFSEKGFNMGNSWYSGPQNTPSQFSSTFGSSFRSMHLKTDALQARRQKVNALPSSLPNQRARPIHTMSSVFGKKDTIAKSWNDMFEEDEDEEEEEIILRGRREYNARSFSHDESDEEAKITPRPSTPLKTKVPAPILVNKQASAVARPTMIATTKLLNENDTYIWQPKTPRRTEAQVPMDRWSQLGDRRRKQVDVTPIPIIPLTTKRATAATPANKKRNVSGVDAGNNTRRQSRNKSNKSRPAWLDQDWRQAKVIDSSEDEDQDQDQHDFVGGWRHFHL